MKPVSVTIVLIVSLAVGYFAGREHVKYEMRQAMSDVGNNFREGMAGIFPSKNKNYAPRNSDKDDAKTFDVTLIKKGFRDFDVDIGSKAITFSIEFTNTLGKDIRAFDGMLVIADILDNPIKKLNLAYTEPVDANETGLWEGEMRYNQFMDSDRQLRSKNADDLKASILLRKVLYDDGTKEEF